MFHLYLNFLQRQSMAFDDDDVDDDQLKKKLPGIGIIKSRRFLLSGTSLASVESLSMPLVQEIVLSADIRCSECQKRVANMMSRLNETESIVVNVLEKKVTLTCRYPLVSKASNGQVTTSYRNPTKRFALFKRMFMSS